MFDEFEDEFLKFERIEKKLSRRPDLHAFLLLDSLCPGDSDIVAAGEHDEIFLGVDAEALKAVATKEQLRDLHRCGVRFDKSTDSLVMFV